MAEFLVIETFFITALEFLVTNAIAPPAFAEFSEKLLFEILAFSRRIYIAPPLAFVVFFLKVPLSIAKLPEL